MGFVVGVHLVSTPTVLCYEDGCDFREAFTSDAEANVAAEGHRRYHAWRWERYEQAIEAGHAPDVAEEIADGARVPDGTPRWPTFKVVLSMTDFGTDAAPLNREALAAAIHDHIADDGLRLLADLEAFSIDGWEVES